MDLRGSRLKIVAASIIALLVLSDSVLLESLREILGSLDDLPSNHQHTMFAKSTATISEKVKSIRQENETNTAPVELAIQLALLYNYAKMLTN